MPVATYNAIYLGKVSQIMDPTEGNSVVEGRNLFNGQSYGSQADPLFTKIISMTANDLGGGLGLDTNNSVSNDTLTFDLGDGNGVRTTTYDAVQAYTNSTITYLDGSTVTVQAIIFQDTQGNLFLAPAFRTTHDAYQKYLSAPLRSIQLGTAAGNELNMGIGYVADNFVTCFTPGTMIDTPDGPRDIADLQAGDLITTVDHGVRPLKWIGRSLVAADQRPTLRPIRIAAGALGQDLPARDLVVSPQHRVLVRSSIARRMFGTDEILVAAKHLTSLPGIAVDHDATGVTYIHMLFDQHELVTANGAPTESLYLGPQAVAGVPEAARREILSLFPELANDEVVRPAPARQLIEGRRGRKLAERHSSNGKPVLELA